MIKSLRLRNFKGIRHVEIALDRLTVIVGPNASGKTSILEGLNYLSRIGTEEREHIFRDGQRPQLLHRRKAGGEAMELSCAQSKGAVRIRFVPSGFHDGDVPKRRGALGKTVAFEARGRPEGGDGEHAGGVQVDAWQDIDKNREVAQLFRPATFLRLDASSMAKPSHGIGDRVAPDGNGLASALTFIALNQPDDFQVIQERLKAVVPSIERIRFERINNSPNSNNSKNYQENIVFDFRGAGNISAHLASEGTILVLGLLTALASRERPELVLLDDLDRGLHPKAQREVVDLFRVILKQNPELQIVATTHSPYLVDNLRPEEVRLTTLDEDGTISCAGLTDHPDFDQWKDEMAPGEMWSLFGEKWVSEVRKNGEAG